VNSLKGGSGMSKSQESNVNTEQQVVTEKPRKKYEFDEAISAMQKEIRRGNLEDALFWAIEVEKNNPIALWNRLVVITSEDIGPANTQISVLIYVLRKNYFRALDHHKSANRLFLTHAIFSLVHSSKSRIVDDLCNAMYGEIEFDFKEKIIPEYDLDKHTKEGRRRKNKWEHFHTEGTKLANETKLLENKWTRRAKNIHELYGELPVDEKLFEKWDKQKESKRQKKIKEQKKHDKEKNNQTKGNQTELNNKKQPETDKKPDTPLDKWSK
jgi:replication-associated recombination protein RarA